MLHQLYKPVPGKFKDHIAIAKVNGYQSLHTTLGRALRRQRGISAAHRCDEPGRGIRRGRALALQGQATPTANHGRAAWATKWLQSLLDIQRETRDAAEFWDHVKDRPVPGRGLCIHASSSQILSHAARRHRG
jgi:guanosine-3',5'-bis(diphosphate) 3'-pyrophosphohydrolase